MRTRNYAQELGSCGFAQIDGPFRAGDGAFDMARELVEICRLEQGLPALSVIGDFVFPPLDGGEPRAHR